MKREQIAGTFVFLLVFVLLTAFLSRIMRGPTVGSRIKETSTENVTEAGLENKAFARSDWRMEICSSILSRATRGLFAGHAADEQFLCWVAAVYGDSVLEAVDEQLRESQTQGAVREMNRTGTAGVESRAVTGSATGAAGAGNGAATGSDAGTAGAGSGAVTGSGAGTAGAGNGAATGSGAGTAGNGIVPGSGAGTSGNGTVTGSDAGTAGNGIGNAEGTVTGSAAGTAGNGAVTGSGAGTAGAGNGAATGSDAGTAGNGAVTGSPEVSADRAQIRLTDAEESQIWREQTGKSMQVLWTEFCLQYGYDFAGVKGVETIECSSEEQITLDFIGDFNLDEECCTMKRMSQEQDGLKACVSETLLRELNEADLAVANNEFVFGSKGEAIEGKDYTFRAKGENVQLLREMGIDLVSLANNHSYDFGEEALLETLRILDEAGIRTVGAGQSLDQADDARYMIANGWKIAIVAATEVERFSNYTKAATATDAGVFKMTDPEHFLDKVREAKAESDYVIAFVHWGDEGKSYQSSEQRTLAEQIAEAGADVIIGDHPHRLQGVEFLGDVPVVYSLGNFWFSDAALFTTVAQITIDQNGKIGLRLIPCVQEEVAVRVIEEEELVTRFLQYVMDLSAKTAIDVTGKVYNLGTDPAVEERVLDALSGCGREWFQSGQAYSRHSSDHDLYGKEIDIVGNLRNRSN